MNEALELYIRNSKVGPEKLKNYVHDPTLGKYPTRFAYRRLQHIAKDFYNLGAKPNLIGLAGLRGVGKTTLMWQAANYIYNNFCKKMYAFEVDKLQNLGISLQEALDALEEIEFEKRFDTSFEQFVILLDEVHDDSKWVKTVKILHDRAKSAFMIATGSSALLLQQSADLAAGRMHIERIYPYKFTEFIAGSAWRSNQSLNPIKNLGYELKQSMFYESNVNDAYSKLSSFNKQINKYWGFIEERVNSNTDDLIKEYLSYHNIPRFLAFRNPIFIRNQILELLKRIISNDVPKYDSEKNEHILQAYSEKILFRLAASDEINPDTLSQAMGIKKDNINTLLVVLEKAELLNVLFPYGGVDTRLVKNKKAFFMSPSIRRALLSVIYGNTLPDEFRSKMMEDLIVMYLKRILADPVISFTSEKGQVNPDFVIETLDKPILIEAGLAKTKAGQIKKSNINYRYGFVISSKLTELTIKGDTIFLPFKWFLML